MRSLVRSSLVGFVVAAGALTVVAAAPSGHLAGPAWISIEYPPNPLDPATRATSIRSS